MDDSIPLFFTQKWDTNQKKFNITVEPKTPYIYIYRTPATCKRSIETDPTLRSPKNYMMRYNKKEKKNVSYTKQRAMMGP